MNICQTYIVEPTSTILYTKAQDGRNYVAPNVLWGFVLGSCFVVYTLSVVSRYATVRADCFTLIAF